jgi:protein TonB
MSFYSGIAIAPVGPRIYEQHLLLACIACSIALHAALLTLLPDMRALRDTPAKPLIVELAKKEEPPVVEPPKKDPEVRPMPREQPPVIKRAQPDPMPQPVIEDKVPPVASAPPVLSVPSVPAAPAPVLVAPVAPPPDPPRAPVVPRVRTDAAYLHNPSPSYPMAARRRGDQGTVTVKVLVTAEGLPTNVSLEKTSGYAALDEAAVNAVRSWRFVPAREGTQAVEALYIVPVVYKLN